MHLNLLPFVFAPGIALMGYLLGGWSGAGYASLGWGAVVVAGTAVVLWRRYASSKRPPGGAAEADEQYSWPGVN